VNQAAYETHARTFCKKRNAYQVHQPYGTINDGRESWIHPACHGSVVFSIRTWGWWSW